MRYEGIILLFAKTGQGATPRFCDDRGLSGPDDSILNPNWSIKFGRRTRIKKLKIWDKEGCLVYNDSWRWDFDNTWANDGIVSPREMKPGKWWGILKRTDDGFRAEIETDEIVPALKESK